MPWIQHRSWLLERIQNIHQPIRRHHVAKPSCTRIWYVAWSWYGIGPRFHYGQCFVDVHCLHRMDAILQLRFYFLHCTNEWLGKLLVLDPEGELNKNHVDRVISYYSIRLNHKIRHPGKNRQRGWSVTDLTVFLSMTDVPRRTMLARTTLLIPLPSWCLARQVDGQE